MAGKRQVTATGKSVVCNAVDRVFFASEGHAGDFKPLVLVRLASLCDG